MPCKGNPLLPATPSQNLVCMNGLNTISAAFFSSPPSCEPAFTSLKISGNAMYVHVCKECVCVCVSF